MTPLMELAWTQFWQVTVVAVGVGLLNRLFCRHRPHLAHMLWLVVLVKCVTPPIWSSPTGVFSWAAAAPSAAAQNERLSVAMTSSPASPFHDHVPQNITEKGSEPPAISSHHSSTIALSEEIVTPPSGDSLTSVQVAMWLAIVWLAGATAYAACVLLATIGWWRTVCVSRKPPAESLAAQVAELRLRLRIRRRVRLWISGEPVGPLSFGWIRPTIVLPQALVENRSTEDMEPLLAHELIHIRRGDALVGLLQVAVQCLWWFHPLIWWANRRIAYERERCCDEEVVAGLAYRPSGYARTLLEVLEMKRQLRWPAALPGARRFEITRKRLERIMVDSARFRKRMPRVYWLVLIVGALVVMPSAGLSGSDDANKQHKTADEKDSAAALMQAVYDGFAWIDSARSLHFRTEAKHTKTDEGLRWEETHPTGYYGGGGKPNPKPYYLNTEWAWNEKGVFHRNDSGREGEANFYRQTQIWDGTVGIAYEESGKKAGNVYVLGNEASRLFNDHSVRYTVQLPLGPRAAHDFWWLPTDMAKYRENWGIAPEDFEFAGKAVVNGRNCHVLESKVGHYRMYVGVDDGRLYRRTHLGYNGENPGFDRLALMRKIAGPAIKTITHWYPWLDNLEPAQVRRARRELEIAQFPFMRPRTDETFDDYREVAPGCWVPFRQSSDFYNLQAPEPFLAQRSEQIVTHLAVNQPLAEDQFRMEMVEGVKVEDCRYDPYISYTYRKDQTEDERIALHEAVKQERAKEDERHFGVINSRMGSAPPALPQTGWLDGQPVTWDQFKGKVIVVHFWEVKNNPAPGELAQLAFWHDHSLDNGIAVIGIVRPTGDLNAVRSPLKEYDAKFPVLIDSPSAKDGGIGALHDWFGASSWVPTVLLNKTGVVAGHGHMVLLKPTIPEQLRRLQE